MRLHIDRSLPVAIGAQLLGQIEYGVSCGSLPPGSQLPSVRELASELGLSPVTVSQVYRVLQERGLLETQPGRGTFVSGSGGHPSAEVSRLSAIHQQIDSLMRSAERLGIGNAELSQIVSLRLRQPRHEGRKVQIAFVGTFREPTRGYAADLRGYLGMVDSILALTFGDLESSGESREQLAEADLVVTFPHRLHEMAPFLQPGVRLVTLRFIPSERTRVLLAEISPQSTVTLVSTFPEFLGTLKDSVTRFAPHLTALHGTVLDDPELDEKIESCEVVIYATGAERVMNGLPGHVRAIEYRHTPDPASIKTDLLPVIDELAAV